MSLPSVSVVVPLHQAESWIAQTLRSALDQTHPPLEILVVDNNSRDRGPEIARGFGGSVRVIEEPTPGACHARMAGLAQARGEAIMFLDADDLLGPEALEGMAEALAAAPGAVALCDWSRLEWVDAGAAEAAQASPDAPPPGTGAAGIWVVRPPSCAPRSPGEDPLAAWLKGWWHSPCSVLWSREGYRRSGGWDPATSISGNDDGELMKRAIAAGVPVVMAARGEAFYRRLPGEAPSLSGKRRTPEGAGAEFAALVRLERQLAAQGVRDRYAGPLVEAHARAGGQLEDAQPDLAAAFRAATARLRASPPGPPPEADALPGGIRDLGPAPRPEEVRMGPVDPAPAPLAAPPSLPPEPLVSVVIPVFNRPDSAPVAVASALAQDWPRLEVVVVDDASTDDSAARIEAIGDPRLRLIRLPRNGGVARARNAGMDAARGEVIGFVDSDDEWLPGKLAAQVPLLLASRRIGIVHGAVENVLADGRTDIVPPPPTGRLFETLLARNVLHAFPTVSLVRREAVRCVGGYDPALPAIEDWEFAIRVARVFDVAAAEAPVARYHDHSAGDAAGLRRSRRIADNLAARAMLHRRYWRDMRRAGVESDFLLDSARRHLGSGFAGRIPAARLLAAELSRRPGDARLYAWLASLALPGRVGAKLRT